MTTQHLQKISWHCCLRNWASTPEAWTTKICRQSCEPIRSHVRKSLLTNMHFDKNRPPSSLLPYPHPTPPQPHPSPTISLLPPITPSLSPWVHTEHPIALAPPSDITRWLKLLAALLCGVPPVAGSRWNHLTRSGRWLMRVWCLGNCCYMLYVSTVSFRVIKATEQVEFSYYGQFNFSKILKISHPPWFPSEREIWDVFCG